MLDAAAEAARMEKELAALGTPGRALQEKRYLKSELDFLGATLGQIHKVVRERRGLSREEAVALAEELWSRPLFERRMAAVLLLEDHAKLVEPADLDLLERLLRESHTWALVDALAANVVGELLVRHPEAVARLDSWAEDDDFWLRRSALLGLGRRLKAGEPLGDRFAGYADAMLEEKEFFIRKAIGWMLREVGKKRPDEVYEWLAPRTARCSGVTMREAVKYLRPEQAEVLMRAYKEKRAVGA